MDTKLNDQGIEVELGSVSHATMRMEDLIPIFLDTLREYDEKSCGKLVKKYFKEKLLSAGGDLRLSDYDALIPEKYCELAGFLLEELFDSLHDIAPEGFYFGAHPGDGSDYGFWPVD